MIMISNLQPSSVLGGVHPHSNLACVLDVPTSRYMIGKPEDQWGYYRHRLDHKDNQLNPER